MQQQEEGFIGESKFVEKNDGKREGGEKQTRATKGQLSLGFGKKEDRPVERHTLYTGGRNCTNRRAYSEDLQPRQEDLATGNG